MTVLVVKNSILVDLDFDMIDVVDFDKIVAVGIGEVAGN
jgi:hypothetical protein